MPLIRETSVEIEGVEVGVSGYSREILLFTGTEVTTGWVREVEEVIVLTGLLPITMESKGNEKGRVYRAHGTLRPFMTELVVSLSSSQHGSYTLGKKGIMRDWKKKKR